MSLPKPNCSCCCLDTLGQKSTDFYLDAVHEEVALPSSNQEAVFEGTDVLDGEGELEKLVDAVCGVHDAGRRDRWLRRKRYCALHEFLSRVQSRPERVVKGHKAFSQHSFLRDGEAGGMLANFDVDPVRPDDLMTTRIAATVDDNGEMGPETRDKVATQIDTDHSPGGVRSTRIMAVDR